VADRTLVAELLAGPYPCCLTTLRASGDPYGVVVWCGRDGERPTVNAAESRWLENLRRDPRVSMVVVDTANILRHVSVDGVVAAIEPDSDYAHIDALSLVYEGRRYAYSTPEEVPRFRVEIEPKRIRTVDISPPPTGTL
jgi:PPOX class probable F420-dependent enzyme